MTRFRSRGLRALSVRPGGGRLLCRLRLPDREEAGHSKELVLVASSTPPHIRRFTVYRQDAAIGPNDLTAA